MVTQSNAGIEHVVFLKRDDLKSTMEVTDTCVQRVSILTSDLDRLLPWCRFWCFCVCSFWMATLWFSSPKAREQSMEGFSSKKKRVTRLPRSLYFSTTDPSMLPLGRSLLSPVTTFTFYHPCSELMLRSRLVGGLTQRPLAPFSLFFCVAGVGSKRAPSKWRRPRGCAWCPWASATFTASCPSPRCFRWRPWGQCSRLAWNHTHTAHSVHRAMVTIQRRLSTWCVLNPSFVHHAVTHSSRSTRPLKRKTSAWAKFANCVTRSVFWILMQTSIHVIFHFSLFHKAVNSGLPPYQKFDKNGKQSSRGEEWRRRSPFMIYWLASDIMLHCKHECRREECALDCVLLRPVFLFEMETHSNDRHLKLVSWIWRVDSSQHISISIPLSTPRFIHIHRRLFSCW